MKKKTFETFKKISDNTIAHLIEKQPSFSSDSVNVRKYRIIIEEVDEYDNIIEERLQELWDLCIKLKATTHNRQLMVTHYRQLLLDEAAKIGYIFKTSELPLL